MRTQLNIRLPEAEADTVQRLLRMIAARLTLDTGRTHTVGEAVSVATRRLADELKVSHMKPKSARRID